MHIKKRISLILGLLLMATSLSAQSKDEMARYQQELEQLFEKAFNAATDNERYNANEQALSMLEEALLGEKSFAWKWSFDHNVSVLTADDDKFKIFSWAIIRDNGEYECFGIMQVYNPKTEEYDVHVLHDKAEEIFNADESTLMADSWYGAVYQDLITIKYEGKVSYTLIGWTGGNTIIQRKVIEPVTFKSNSSQPIFGAPVFKHDRNIRRVLLQYSKNAMVNVRYDEQYFVVEEKKKENKNGKMVTVTVPHEEKEKMIVFDDVSPVIEGMEGLYQYYVPSGLENAFYFNNGKWILRENIRGRLHETRAKDFTPLKKKPAAYTVPPAEGLPAEKK